MANTPQPRTTESDDELAYLTSDLNGIVAFWPSAGTRRLLRYSEVERPQWREGDLVRVIHSRVVSGSAFVRVWLEDRHHLGLVFRLDINRFGQMLGFSVRPLVFVEESDGETPMTKAFEIDEDAAFEDSVELSAHMLQREVQIGRLHVAATQAVQKLGAVLLDPTAPVVKDGSPARVRRSSVSDLDLARFAQEYRRLLDAGQGDDVSARLASAYHLSLDGVSYRIRRARRLGILTSTTRGRPGGHLTTKSVALLEANE